MNERSFIVNTYSPSERFSDYELAWFLRLLFGETTFLGKPGLPACSRQPLLQECLGTAFKTLYSDPLAPRVATWAAQLALVPPYHQRGLGSVAR
jgi:hypothetical protein